MYTTVLILLVIALVSWYKLSPNHRSRPLLPPGISGILLSQMQYVVNVEHIGPKPLPFIGNLHQLPLVDPLKTYAEWTSSYGPMISLSIFGRPFLIVNSLKICIDLLEGRSAKYSSRPRFVMAGELMGRETTSLVFTTYGAVFKTARRILHHWLSQERMRKYWPLQLEEHKIRVHRLLLDIIESPEDFTEHIRFYAGSMMIKLIYGFETLPDESYIANLHHASNLTSQAARPGWLVDSFPSLSVIPSWFPGARFKRWALEAKLFNCNTACAPYEKFESNLQQGKNLDCWLSEEFNGKEGNGNTPECDRQTIIKVAVSAYNGGVDTTVPAIRTFILAMIRHPEIQKRGQQEIDSVIGNTRLPEIEDIESLPYVKSIVKEVLRINPPVPVFPHTTDVDDEYDGYRILKGTYIAVNAWALGHDTGKYKESDVFNPDRFMGDAPEEDINFAFGFGRRKCPGEQLARTNTFIIMANLLSFFTMSPTAEGRPPFEFDLTLVSDPKPFRCVFTVRHPQKSQLVRGTLEGANLKLGKSAE